MLNEERSFSSLEEVTKLLIAAEGKTFRELDETGRGDSAGNKGSLGNIIEESVLHYPVNSDAEADILVGDTRYELKVTPLKHSGKGKRTKTVAKERLVLDIINYENLGIGRLIYQLPTTLCEMFLQEVFKKNPIDALDQETLVTINKFFENNLNVSETARKLFVHRNTLVYRLEKIKKLTGLDLREFDDAITFKVALMVKKYLTSRGIDA